jgi:hypothetical protein
MISPLVLVLRVCGVTLLTASAWWAWYAPQSVLFRVCQANDEALDTILAKYCPEQRAECSQELTIIWEVFLIGATITSTLLLLLSVAVYTKRPGYDTVATVRFMRYTTFLHGVFLIYMYYLVLKDCSPVHFSDCLVDLGPGEEQMKWSAYLPSMDCEPDIRQTKPRLQMFVKYVVVSGFNLSAPWLCMMMGVMSLMVELCTVEQKYV